MAWPTEPGHRRGVNPSQRARIMRRDAGICHRCGHGCTDQIDHVIGVKQWAREDREGSPHRDSNLAPIHQAPCPVCGATCHRDKTQKESRAGSAAARAPMYHPQEHHPGRLSTR